MPVRKILVVDDSATDRQFLLEGLSRLGYQVILAENGDDAVTKTRAEMPDLVLMDVVMPGVSGFQATRQIARDAATKHIPVIMCTTKTQDTDRIWGLRQGARDYLTKPINVTELAAKIASLG
jgi:twitching motility two-component system response regulator PilH